MKNLIKWSAAVGIVFCLLGIGIMTAGAMVGGMGELNLYLNQSDLKVGVEHRVLQPWETYGSVAEKVEETDCEDLLLEAVEQYPAIRNLRLEVGAGKVELREMEELHEDAVGVEHFGDGKPYLVEQEGDELKIGYPDYVDWHNAEGMETIVICVPVGFRFDELRVEVKAGSFYAKQISAEQLSLEAEAGEIRIRGGNAACLDAEVRAGLIDCRAEVERTISAECSAGSVNLLLAGEKQEYDYQLECSGGSIVLNGEETEEYAQLHQKKHIDNHTGNTVELDCQMGTITVDFQLPAV